MGRPRFSDADGHAYRIPTCHRLPEGIRTHGNRRQGSGLVSYPCFLWIRHSPLGSRKTHDPSGLWLRCARRAHGHPLNLNGEYPPSSFTSSHFWSSITLRSLGLNVTRYSLQHVPQAWQSQFWRTGSGRRPCPIAWFRCEKDDNCARGYSEAANQAERIQSVAVIKANSRHIIPMVPNNPIQL